jgi:hypothetical protein
MLDFIQQTLDEASRQLLKPSNSRYLSHLPMPTLQNARPRGIEALCKYHFEALLGPLPLLLRVGYSQSHMVACRCHITHALLPTLQAPRETPITTARHCDSEKLASEMLLPLAHLRLQSLLHILSLPLGR